jgi:hypothetical protein
MEHIVHENGIEKATMLLIKNLIGNDNLTVDQALDILEIEDKERNIYKEAIETEKM